MVTLPNNKIINVSASVAERMVLETSCKVVIDMSIHMYVKDSLSFVPESST